MSAPAGGLEGQSPNGFLADQDREEASEPMLANINLAKNAKIKVDTGKSFSEELILASTNPQFGKRLFIELRVQYMTIASSEHVLY